MKPIAIGLGALSLALCLTDEVRGHGGAYRGPGVSIPPPGAGQPGTGAPRTPGSGPGTGGGPITNPGGFSRTAARKRSAPDYTNWNTWWEFNKDPFLNLRARLGTRFSVTGLGRDGIGGEAGETSVRPGFAELKTDMLPVLKKLVREDDAEIVDSAVLALARVTPKDQADLVLKEIQTALRHREQSVRQSAILSLGVLGHQDAVPLLLEIVQDSKDGRQLLASTQTVGQAQQAMAAVALGYLSDPRGIPVLQKIIQKGDDADLDLKASAILALGLYRDSQFEIVRFLLDELGDRKASETIRAQVPIALARLGDAARPMLPELLKLVESKKTRNQVRQSCVLALGQIAAPEDQEALRTLRKLVQKTSDRSTRNFAFVALGQIGARAAAEGERYGEMVNDLHRYLLRNLVRPKKNDQLPWIATACAILARTYPADSDARKEVADRLGRAWKQSKNPNERGALTICLGLVEARSMGDALLEELKDSGDRQQNGLTAEALGLMRHEKAADDLLKILENDNDARYRVQVATGLGLMGDLEVSELLVKEFRRSKTLWEVSAVAKALGNVGDRSAVAPLLEMVQKRHMPSLSRAFGAVALGLIGEKTPLPWNARVSVGANYIAAFYTQTQIMDIL